MKEMYNKVKDKTNANYYVMKKLLKSASEQIEQKFNCIFARFALLILLNNLLNKKVCF